MFTGLIEEVGVIKDVERKGNVLLFTVQGKVVVEDLEEGDSIAVNGVCLTVTQRKEDTFTVEVSPETLSVTTFSGLGRGERVNLERPLRASDRLGGHLVTGHIDGMGRIEGRRGREDSFSLWITAPLEIMDYVVERGSIAVEGVSLTVVEVKENMFRVNIIPHTAKMTTLGNRRAGERVNLEADLVAKYIKKFSSERKEGVITPDFLRSKGFI